MIKHLVWLQCLWGFTLLTLLGLGACGQTSQSAAEAKPPIASRATSGSPQERAPAASDATTSGAQPTDSQPSTSSRSTDQQDPIGKPMPKRVPPEPLDDTTAAPVPTTTPNAAAVVAAPNKGDAWRTYRNEKAGYAVKYPSDWKVEEQTGTDDALMTTFRPTAGGAGITVSVQSGEMDQGVSDIPNTRCQQVKVGELSGTRCFDTLSFSTSTTLVGGGKTYTIAVFGKRLDRNIYQRFLESFRPIS